ncbi:MAG: hypothetical protein Q4G52_10260 [Clostridia bacterium]|nr:hypothetical protein [Clostridia bacterium]
MAFCGLIVALSVTLMLAGGLIPIATYGAPLYAGILLLPIMLEYGKKTAWTAYAAIVLISLALCPDKEAAFFFLFFGHYPVLKWQLDRLKSKPVRLALKLLIYNALFLAMVAVLGYVLGMSAVLDEFRAMGGGMMVSFIVLFNVCMLLYDRLLAALVVLYVKKLRPRLKFLRN